MLVSLGDTLTPSGDLRCATEYHTPHSNHSSSEDREKQKHLWGNASKKYTNKIKTGILPVHFSLDQLKILADSQDI